MINELDNFNLDCIAQYILCFVVDRKKAFHLYWRLLIMEY